MIARVTGRAAIDNIAVAVSPDENIKHLDGILKKKSYQVLYGPGFKPRKTTNALASSGQGFSSGIKPPSWIGRATEGRPKYSSSPAWRFVS
jgi:hypothetical protein